MNTILQKSFLFTALSLMCVQPVFADAKGPSPVKDFATIAQAEAECKKVAGPGGHLEVTRTIPVVARYACYDKKLGVVFFTGTTTLQTIQAAPQAAPIPSQAAPTPVVPRAGLIGGKRPELLWDKKAPTPVTPAQPSTKPLAPKITTVPAQVRVDSANEALALEMKNAGRDAQTVAAALKARGVSAPETAKILMKVFNLTDAGANAKVLKAAGFAGQQIGDALKKVFGFSAVMVRNHLKALGPLGDLGDSSCLDPWETPCSTTIGGRDGIVDPGPLAPPTEVSGSLGSLGTRQMPGCNATTSDISFLANGMPIGGRGLDKPRVSVFAGPLGTLYKIKGLRPGTHVIAPKLRAGVCPAGDWSPASLTVTLRNDTDISSNQNFSYQVYTNARETRIPLIDVAREVLSVFIDTKIHMNNYGPRRGDSWHMANDSWVDLPKALLGIRFPFNIPEGRDGPRRYYIQDMTTLPKLSLGTYGGESSPAVSIAFPFESDGTELKGRCPGDNVTCWVGSDSGAPDFQINNARITAIFPIKPGGSAGITYDQVRLSFAAAIDGQGLGEFYEGEARTKIIQAIQPLSALFTNSPAINAVTQRWRILLDSRGVGHVYYVRGSGANLVIVHVPLPKP